VEITNDRLWPPHQDTTDLDGAIPRQQLSSTCSPLPPSTSCGQASPEPLACPLVAPSELIQVTDLLALFAGVDSTTPVVVSTWPTLLTTTSSEEGVVVAPRVGTVPAPTQRLSHAFGGPADPSRHMSVASSVTTRLAKSRGHGLGGNKSLSPQGGVSDTPASLTLGPEIGTPIAHSATGGQGKDVMEIDDVHAASCVGQPAAVLITMGSPTGGEDLTGDGHSHDGGLLTSGTTKKKRRSGSAKHSAGNVGDHNQVSRHQNHLTYLSKQ